jgi:RNA recognition motif-containing protein
MAKKIHVGNLSYSVSDESLRGAFAPFGDVESVTVVRDKISGRSKGFGFVEMSTDEDAAAAIEKLNKTAFEGRTIFVSESKSIEKPAAPRGRFGGSRDMRPPRR